VSRDPHLSKPCDRHFPSNFNRKQQLSPRRLGRRMTFEMRQSVMTARASKSASAPNSLSSMPNARLIIPLQDVPSTKRRRLRQHQFARFMRPQRSCRSSFSASGYAQIRGRARGELFWSERRARLGLPNKPLKQTVAVATAEGRGSGARSLTAVRSGQKASVVGRCREDDLETTF
jgi:hypothetical protein